MTDLIDSTEMYLRTVWELEEEGIPAIRARLAERLHLSAPSVSQAVGRLEEAGLLRLRADRTLELTEEGRELAVSVMRKHRLAERLLVDVIGLEWPLVHAEACRWEHVISDAVADRLSGMLDGQTHDPHGNPIPGEPAETAAPATSLADVAEESPATTVIERISEHLQADVALMQRFHAHGVLPGTTVTVRREAGDVVIDDGGVRLPVERAGLVYVGAPTSA